MNRFTLIIHNKGWSVGNACKYWGIRYKTYNARCNNPKMFNQLECMCKGLDDKVIFEPLKCIRANGVIPYENQITRI